MLRVVPRLRGMPVTVADQALVSATNFLTNVILARSMPLDDFGRFALLYTVLLFAVAVQLGLIIAPMMSLGAKFEGAEKRTYLSVVTLHALLFALLIAGGAVFCPDILQTIIDEGGFVETRWAFVFCSVGFVLHDFIRRLFFTDGQTVHALAIDGVNCTLRLFVLAGLSLAGVLSVAAALWVIGGASALAIALALKWLALPRPLAALQLLIRSAWVSVQQWHLGKWLLGANIMSWVVSSGLLVLAGNWIGTGPLGVIRAAQNLVGVLLVILQALENLVPHQASARLVQGGSAALRRYMLRTGLVSGACIFALAAVFAGAADFWLQLVYGAQFAGNAAILVFAAVNFVPLFVQVMASFVLRSLGHARGIFLASVLAAAGSVALALILIPPFGALGVMIAICAGSTVNAGALLLLVQRSLKEYPDLPAK
ncbi:MAG: polysaccharide biosynthesis C-terminal domain-containing protein [Defluviicoccus sp.]